MMSRPANPANYASPVTAAASSRVGSVWKDRLEQEQAQAQGHIESNDLANILIKAGLLSQEQFCDAQEIAESLKKTVDQVVVTSFLAPELRDTVQKANLFFQQGLINENLTLDALRLAVHKQIKFEEALRYFGYGW